VRTGVAAAGKLMDATNLRAATALFLMCLAVLARGAHAAPTTPATNLPCTITGTPARDIMAGTAGPDVICGLGGNDMIDSGGGNDVVYAGPGNDIIEGGAGRDTIYGGPGNDTFLVWDGARDMLDGGLGRDRAFSDRLDKFRSVEIFG
jgi:Ca2+-binding RTX toxin-like protein